MTMELILHFFHWLQGCFEERMQLKILMLPRWTVFVVYSELNLKILSRRPIGKIGSTRKSWVGPCINDGKILLERLVVGTPIIARRIVTWAT